MSSHSWRDQSLGILVIIECLLIVGLAAVLVWGGAAMINRGNKQPTEVPSLVGVSATAAQVIIQPTATLPPIPSISPLADTPAPTVTSEPALGPATVAPTEPPEPSPTTLASPTELSLPTSPPEIEAWPQEVFQIINQVRAENGLPPYVYNETLERAARLHGQDCLQRGYCDHTGSDGSDVQARITRAGYDAAGWAEVIVYSSSPQAAVDWWMDEVPPDDPHRRTLLSTWLTEIGVAVVDAGHTYYFIADFGRPNSP